MFIGLDLGTSRLKCILIFPEFTASKLAWLEGNEPKLFDRAHKVLFHNDFLHFWPTGKYFTEMSDASGTRWLDTKTCD
jgi:xylulokinase